MKRCSECHFTFEDYQQFCDFDGTKLTPVPEPPSLSQISVPSAVFPSRVGRILRSRISLAALALAGVVSSALLVGYYDSLNQPNLEVVVSAESPGAVVSHVPAQVETSSQPETQTARTRGITTQRRIKAAENSSRPASMIKWPAQDSPLRSSRSRRGPSPSRPAATNRRPLKTNRALQARNQKQPGSAPRARGQHKTAAVAKVRQRRNESRGFNRQSQARNQTRVRLSERDRQRRSVARAASGKCGAAQPCNSGGGEASHHKSDSKVVAFLKATGRLLKRPFQF